MVLASDQPIFPIRVVGATVCVSSRTKYTITFSSGWTMSESEGGEISAVIHNTIRLRQQWETAAERELTAANLVDRFQATPRRGIWTLAIDELGNCRLSVQDDWKGKTESEAVSAAGALAFLAKLARTPTAHSTIFD